MPALRSYSTMTDRSDRHGRRRLCGSLALSGALLLSACASTPQEAAAPAVVDEVASVATIPDGVQHTVYIPDLAFNHLVDGFVHVIDGDSLRYLGKVSTGFTGFFNVSRDGRELYTASTYYERLNRGKRTDTVAVYDSKTLLLTKEIVIPSKHAQDVPYPAFLVPASSGSWLYTQNATPASSVAIVDTAAASDIGEIATAGCYGIFPSPTLATRFTTLCGDGTALTITLDRDGKERSRTHSAKLFDPDGDAWFLATADDGAHTIFVSFHGIVHVLDLSGDSAVEIGSPWALASGALAAAHWRPGGDQILAYQRHDGQLFVTMHRHGEEGTHKNGADEIWQLDMASHRLVERIAGAQALSLAVTQDAHPRLYAVSGKDGSLRRYDIEHGLRRDGEIAAPLAETPATLLLH